MGSLRALYCCAITAAAACGRVSFDAGSDATEGDTRNLPAGPTLHLPMDREPQGSVEDLVGGHLVACSRCPALVPGRIGGAHAFDGASDSFLSVPYAVDLDTSAAFTIALWFRVDVINADANNCFVTKPLATGTVNTFVLCLRNSDGRSIFDSTGPAGYSYDAGPAVSLGEWHHVAMTWDGVTKRGYLDAAKVFDAAREIDSDDNGLVLAADSNNGLPVYRLIGALDDVLFWQRALGDDEIAVLTVD